MSSDATIMLRRNFKHTVRNPVTVFNAIFMPIIMMLIFVYVFGDAFSVGGDYIDYATPGMLMMTLAYGLSATAVAVNSDMAKGIINRFKVMDVSRGAVLTGQVIASLLNNVIAVAAIVGTAFALGFRPSASLLDWLGVAGMVVLAGFTIGWFTVALGLSAKSVETAGLATVPLIMLPFLSTAIVPADKMGPGARQFAEYQPFTPIIESLRALLAGESPGGDLIAGAAWCALIALVGYVWAKRLYNREPGR